MAWVLDLDGVVWLRREPIPGAAEAVAYLRERGHRVVFATNFSASTVKVIETALENIGIPAHGQVVTSAMAAASLMNPGQSAFVVGGDGIRESLLMRGVEIAGPGAAADAVIAGIALDLSYQLLDDALQALLGGARLVATNTDSTYLTPDGVHPGGGAIVAALECCSGQKATVAGKPSYPQADLIRNLVAGDVGTAPLGAVGDMMVGDKYETDGVFATELGYTFGHVLTGVDTDPLSDHFAPDLYELARRYG